MTIPRLTHLGFPTRLDINKNPASQMSAQATENTAHPTPPHTEPRSETSETEIPEQRRQETQETGKKPSKPKTETEEKIEKETPSLSADSAASEVDGAQQDDTGNHVIARGPKRHDVAKRGKEHASGQTYQPQDGQQVAAQNQQVQSQGKGAPSLRLDMDLDVEIDLKAKINGDVELSILDGK
ncbi:hypothetical protein CTA2_6659 [Colletotrichum tanaceti]|uniref:Uncharacterized protein n=1 Tax=Colletotrichum tanaceti TaxID=1306861 RepID=A0A4U6X7V1_9PEZI|nr:hypothetical protein CTA2_6659 [Colletotrichum tanaceti]TKW51588.1 hypothetical protein CTA1_10114 [Colletotrichum tanaceti]